MLDTMTDAIDLDPAPAPSASRRPRRLVTVAVALAALAGLGAGAIVFRPAAPSAWTVEAMVKLDSPTGTGETALAEWTTSGDPYSWQLIAQDAPINKVLLRSTSVDGTTRLLEFTTDQSDAFDGQWHRYQVTRQITDAAVITLLLDGGTALNYRVRGAVGQTLGPVRISPDADRLRIDLALSVWTSQEG